MENSPTIRLATRGSPLALAQAEFVATRLRAASPCLAVELVVVRTEADRAPERPLRAFGDKAVFVREVEAELAAGRADAAVHSLKDMPAELAPPFVLAAVPAREDPHDVLVARGGALRLDLLPPRVRVATSSLRRRGQILHHRPDVQIVEIRGNVDTRLRKLADGQADALVLAKAGLIRLGHPRAAFRVIAAEVVVPAPCQGALAIEAPADSPWLPLLGSIDDPAARLACEAEREFVRQIGADCHTPVGCLCEVTGEALRLRAAVCAPDGVRLLRIEKKAARADAGAAARQAATELLACGAGRIMELARQSAARGEEGHA